jgi:hypothetical protein
VAPPVQVAPASVDQHRPERLVAGVDRLGDQLDRPAQAAPVLVVHDLLPRQVKGRDLPQILPRPATRRFSACADRPP